MFLENCCNLPRSFDPCKSVICGEGFAFEIRAHPRQSAQLLLFRSPDHQITRDHPISFNPLEFF
jgi:hypothetical protein